MKMHNIYSHTLACKYSSAFTYLHQGYTPVLFTFLPENIGTVLMLHVTDTI